jgi:hypothetical protein
MVESRFSPIPYSQHWFESLKVALEFSIFLLLLMGNGFQFLQGHVSLICHWWSQTWFLILRLNYFLWYLSTFCLYHFCTSSKWNTCCVWTPNNHETPSSNARVTNLIHNLNIPFNHKIMILAYILGTPLDFNTTCAIIKKN